MLDYQKKGSIGRSEISFFVQEIEAEFGVTNVVDQILDMVLQPYTIRVDALIPN